MKILFLIIGPVSFNTAHFIRNFLKQLDITEHSFSIMAEEYTFQYLEITRGINFCSMDKNFGDNKWYEFMINMAPELIIVANLDLLLFQPEHVKFKKKYFEDIKVKTLFLATNNQLTYKKNVIFLSNKTRANIKINFPSAVMMSCPPFIPDVNDGQNTMPIFYWSNLEPFAFISRSDSSIKLKEALKASEESRTIVLLFDIEKVIMAANEGLNMHYKIVIELLCYYLDKLNMPINLVIGNMTHISIDNVSKNVKHYFFGPLTEELNELIIRGSELIITESISGVNLIAAANLKIPVINIKNTLTFEILKDEDGNDVFDVLFNFNEITEFVNTKLHELIINCPQAIFPYYSFPNQTSVNFEEKKVFGHYIFTFTEIFDEIGTTTLLKNLLINQEHIKEEVYRIEQYLELRSDSMDAVEIIECLNP